MRHFRLNELEHQGVSTFDTLEGATSKIPVLERGGKTVYGVAELRIPKDASGVTIQKTLGKGYYTLTGDPSNLSKYWTKSHIRNE